MWVIVPWRVWEYPGRIQALSELLGVARGTARKYLTGEARLVKAKRERLAAYLRSDLAERLEVIRLLEAEDPRDEEVRRLRMEWLAKAHRVTRERHIARLRGWEKGPPEG